MWYSIFKEDNKIRIRNQGIKEITTKVFLEDNELSRSFINLEQEIEITIPQQEGLYRLEIFTGDNTINYLLPNYPNLLKDLIQDIKKVLCQGKSTCSTCNSIEANSKEECELLKEVLTKLLFYYTLMGQYYQPYFNILTETLKKEINKDYSCMKMQEIVMGRANDSNFIKRFISLMYLTFFQAEKDLGINNSTQELLDKYEYNTISNCLVGVSDFFLNRMCEEHRGIIKIGDRLIDLTNDRKVITFTQKDFKDALTPQYFHSKMGELESITICSIVEGDLCRFLYKNEILEEGQVITMNEIGKGFLKFYPQSKKLDYPVKSYFTFTVKSKTSNKISNVSKYLIIT